MPVGRISRAHGVRGGWAVIPLTEASDAVFASGAVVFAGDRNGELTRRDGAPVALHVEDGRPMTREWLVRVREITDREVAHTWRGRHLLAAADDLPPLPEDQLYVATLVGMAVEVAGQGPVGHVCDVYEAPQGLLLEVETATGRHLVPWQEALVADLDEVGRRIVLYPLEGLLG